MNTRKSKLGDKNIVGARVTLARKNLELKQVELLARLQTSGIDIIASTLSQIEGQKRPVKDYELAALSKILGVSANWLLGIEE